MPFRLPKLTLFFVLTLCTTLFLLVLSTAFAQEEARQDQEQTNLSGQVVSDQNGERTNYLKKDQRVRLTESNGIRSIVLDSVAETNIDELHNGENRSQAIQLNERDYLRKIWKTGHFGTGIGSSGLITIDLDKDGDLEVVTGGGAGFGGNYFWYIVGYEPNSESYVQEWISDSYPSTIKSISVSDLNKDGGYEIVIGLYDGNIHIYSADSFEEIGKFTNEYGALQDIVIEDIDSDDQIELITSAQNGLAIYDAATYVNEWKTSEFGSYDIEVGNVDEDSALEIVTTRYVIDSATKEIDWDNESGFGAIIQLANIDEDSMDEIIGAQGWYQLNTFDADTQAPKYDIPADLDIDALIVLDYDNDGVQEIVYGDGQWGSVYVIDSQTKELEWSIRNPEHGVAGIAFGDVDSDDVQEILWGAGWSSTGSDHLFIGDTKTQTIEWRSVDLDGPFTPVDVGDVDNDGTDEIVVAIYGTNSGYDDGFISIYNAETYELEWQGEPILNGSAWHGINALELANIDEDEALEIIIATAYLHDGLIIAYDGITREVEWETERYNGALFTALEVADIDGDDQLEVLGGQDREHTGAEGVYLRVFNGADGIEEWRTTNLSYWGGVYDIETGNFDEDSNQEILFSVTGANAYIYDGTLQTQEWVSELTGVMAVSSIDLEQDGKTEFLLGTNNGDIYAYASNSADISVANTTYEELWSDSFSSNTSSIHSIKLTDFDRDTKNELTLTDNNHIYVYDASSRSKLWQSNHLGSAVGHRGHLIIGDFDNNTRANVIFGSSEALFAYEYDFLPFDSTIIADKLVARPGDEVAYDVGLTSFSSILLSTEVTNTLSPQTSLIPDTLMSGAESYIVGDGDIFASDILTSNEAITLSYKTVIDGSTPDNTEIVNTLLITAGGFIDQKSITIMVDGEAPTATISNLSDETILTGLVYTVTGTAHDSVSGLDTVEIRINEGDWEQVDGTTEWNYVWELPTLDAEFDIYVRATDKVAYQQEILTQKTIYVDNLHPRIISIQPGHSDKDFPTEEPILIEFSEKIVVETFDIDCFPKLNFPQFYLDSTQKALSVIHEGLEPETTYSCRIISAEDLAGHPLTAGEVSHLWAFTTEAEEDLSTPIPNPPSTPIPSPTSTPVPTSTPDPSAGVNSIIYLPYIALDN